MLIGIDGINGCGKTTIINRLRQRYNEAIFTKEPGETSLGVQLREILLNRKYPIEPVSELLLFAADHHENWEKVVKPGLADGRMVFTDRSYVSSLAFQGELGIDRNFISNLISKLTSVDYDLVIILDCDLEIANGRMKRTKDFIESRDSDYMNRVQKYFKSWVFTSDGEYISSQVSRRYIDTSYLTPDQVFEKVIETIEGHSAYAS